MNSKQTARSQAPKPAEPKPSGVTDVFWLSAKGNEQAYPAATARCGKWLIFSSVSRIDELWERIKLAIEQGRLGSSAKVATAKPNPNATNPDTKVICVYTYDWTDESDVRRIRQVLRELGITSKIPYKADEDTHAGRYAAQGHRRISKYYE